MREKTRTWSRRGFLAVGAIGVSAAGLAAAWRRWRTIGTLEHPQDLPGDALQNPDVKSTLVRFMGAMHGVQLKTVDIEDLASRLEFAAAVDGAWAEEYRWFAGYLDELARDASQVSFIDADPDTQASLIRSVIQPEIDFRTQRIRAFFAVEGRRILRMRKTTIPHLARLYRMSGVPWRQRGYTSWPGMPDEQLAYTRPLPPRQC